MGMVKGLHMLEGLHITSASQALVIARILNAGPEPHAVLYREDQSDDPQQAVPSCVSKFSINLAPSIRDEYVLFWRVFLWIWVVEARVDRMEKGGGGGR